MRSKYLYSVFKLILIFNSGFLLYAQNTSEEILNKDSKKDTIILKTKNIQEVKIKSKTPEIKRLANGYSFEIEKTFLALGNDVNTILPLLPGVTTDNEGGISLNNGSVLLMIDNREIKLPTSQLKLYLSNIRSENIKNIEVITSPTSAYDAQGINGIIKINTKIKIEENYSGNITNKYMQGIYAKDELSANIIYSRKKTLFYAGISGNVNNNFIDLQSERNNTALNLKQYNLLYLKNKNSGLNASAGIRYDIDEKDLLNFDFSFGKNKSNIRDDIAEMIYKVYENNNLNNYIKSYTPTNSNSNVSSLSTNFQRNTDNNGSNFKITSDYLFIKSLSYNFYSNNNYDSNNVFTNNETNDNNIDRSFNIFSIKADNHKVFKSKNSLDYGLKYANANTKVENLSRDLLNNNWMTDSTLSNNLNYKENIFAGYLSYSAKIKNTKIISGIRGEFTDYNVQSYKDNYFKIFPSLSISFPVDTKNNSSLTFNFNKRINRPSYEILNPFIYKIDEYSIKSGNPYLKPSISNKISATYSFKKNYSIGFSFEKENNVFGEVQKPQSDGTTLQSFDNIDNKIECDLLGNATFFIKKYWIMVWQLTLFDKKYNSPNYEANNLGLIFANINIFKISQNFDIRLTSQFMSKGADRYTIMNKNFIFSSIDLNKILGKSGFQLKFGANDIFNTRGNMSVSYNYLQQHNTSIIKRDSRYFYVALTYNFKKGKDIQKKEYQKSNIEEEQRAN